MDILSNCNSDSNIEYLGLHPFDTGFMSFCPEGCKLNQYCLITRHIGISLFSIPISDYFTTAHYKFTIQSRKCNIKALQGCRINPILPACSVNFIMYLKE